MDKNTLLHFPAVDKIMLFTHMSQGYYIIRGEEIDYALTERDLKTSMYLGFIFKVGNL